MLISILSLLLLPLLKCGHIYVGEALLFYKNEVI